MASTEVTQMILIAATTIPSVVLAISCLFRKRFTKKERNESSQASDESKSGENKDRENSTVNGITNTGFAEGDSESYKNDANQYDYAKNDGTLASRNGKTHDALTRNISPLYTEASDEGSRFYFTLERSTNKTSKAIDEDDGDYVVVVPENVYDVPDNESDEVTNANPHEDESQVYYTLEECRDESENGSAVADGNKDFTNITHDIKDEKYKDRMENRVSTGILQTSDEDTYVINIQSDGISETDIHGNGCAKISTGDELGVEKIIIDIPNEYSGQPVEKEENIDTHEQIYQNLNECLNHKNNSKISQETQPRGYAVQIENTKITKKNSAKTRKSLPDEINFADDNTHINTGYIDDEILSQNGDESSVDDESPYVIQIEALNEGIRDNQQYFDDDIYEDWEDNIIGRTKLSYDESRNEDNVDCGDDIYQNAIILLS